MSVNFKSKKFRYGSVATVITVLAVALIIVLNYIVSVFAARFRWYSDMTNSSLFSLSDAFVETLEDVEAPVKIIFCADPDELMADEEYMRFIYSTASNLEARFDNITVEYHDVIKEYDFFKSYADTAASNIYTDSIIIESGKEFRLMKPEAFFIFDTEDNNRAWAYNGEKKFAAAILQVTATDNPRVLFTAKHGETLGSTASSFLTLFSDAGFDVGTIDLSAEEIPDDCRIVVINDPVYDFIGMEAETESANEIRKLDAFLDRLGALMVFEDYDKSSKLRNLNEFLEEWGISFENGTYLTDAEHSTSVDGATIVAAYEEKGIGASIYMDMAELDTMPRTLLREAMPVNVLWTDNATESGTKQVFPVLSAYDTAKAMKNGTEGEAESRTLMTVSRDKIIVNNENSSADYIYSYVIACGAPSFVRDDYLVSNSYGNADIIYAAMRAVGRENLLADIAYKEFDNVTLTITTAQATRWTILFATVPPLIVAICGVVVRIKRKNS